MSKREEKFEFQSEVKQLLQILVYSLYEHKEVFLRELISNAVDAINKVKFEGLKSDSLEDADLEDKIKIEIDKDKKMIAVEDTGIGMSKEELIENLGTIAHSGTGEFLEKLKDAENNSKDLIGKFGVGFYASFMVAKEIKVYTKSYLQGSKSFLWTSSGDTSYKIEEIENRKRGTLIELYLKDDEDEFLEKYRLESIIEKHSKFIPFPLYIGKDKIESREAIWRQPKNSLKEEDYQEFYSFISQGGGKPESYLHLSSDAPVQFNSLLFIPESNIELNGLFKEQIGVDLYSRKVLIQKSCKELMPEYLRFVKGLVDSEDLPLNISRETIQKTALVNKIKNYIMKKLFSHLKDMKNKDFEKYLKIWKNFNRNFKEGITTDFLNKDSLSELLLFNTSQSGKDLKDLNSYVKEMKEGQELIYFATGMDIDSIEKNPALEALKEKEYEVLYLTDPIDEIVIDHLREYKGKKFKIAESADIKLDRKLDDKEFEKDVNSFLTYLKSIYGDTVNEVRVSERLVNSPCILAGAEDGPSLQMEKVMKMVNKEYSYSKKNFEINPHNALIKELIRIHKVNPASNELKELSLQLRDNQILREGVLDQIDTIIPRMQEIMLKAAEKTNK